MVEHFIVRQICTGCVFCCLRKEVRKFGIKVSVVYSGLVDTPFHANPGSDRRAGWLSDEDMSNAICFMMSQPSHVVIDELMIHPQSQEY
jgi:NADP-dependent 3-hydroxy acid dehydrogenase YdfG